jgi:hypothetical protein
MKEIQKLNFLSFLDLLLEFVLNSMEVTFCIIRVGLIT